MESNKSCLSCKNGEKNLPNVLRLQELEIWSELHVKRPKWTILKGGSPHRIVHLGLFFFGSPYRIVDLGLLTCISDQISNSCDSVLFTKNQIILYLNSQMRVFDIQLTYSIVGYCRIYWWTEKALIRLHRLLYLHMHEALNLFLLNPDKPCLYKQCTSRSVAFFKSQLIWICTVYH